MTREGACSPDSFARDGPSSGVTYVLWKLVLFLRPKILGSGLLEDRLWACWRAPAVRGRVGERALRSWFNVGWSRYSGGGRGSGLSRGLLLALPAESRRDDHEDGGGIERDRPSGPP